MPSEILLLACYELGRQPLSLAWPLAFMRSAGLEARAVDLAVERLPDDLAAEARFVALAVPMHTALRRGVETARQLRALNPRAHLCFFGLYAWLNADMLLAGPADSVIGGEYEAPLTELARTVLAGGAPATVPGVSAARHRAQPHLARLRFPRPERAALPALDRYARYAQAGELRLAGAVEASRGCRHTCRHCPITPLYRGRFFVVPPEMVLADARQQIHAGAEHITFGDPDFLNGPGHALRVARGLHQEFPRVTFDFTTKVEHILRHAGMFPEFAALGCTFVVSAIESTSDHVLRQLDKGHTAADIDRALAALDAAGIALQPTLVPFTPWTSLDDYLGLVDFLLERRLETHVPPIQLAIRLLVPPGSALLEAPDADLWRGALDPQAFTYRWRHPDARMDDLQARVFARVQAAQQAGEAARETYHAVRALAYALAGRPLPPARGTPAERPAPPRLTEDWFC